MKYRFSICACARWEAPYIVEWLSYYQSIGFEHIYLYCNDDDPTALYEATLPFQAGDKPFVTFYHFPFQGQQYFMYEHFLKQHRLETEWIAFFDIDEFLILKDTDDISRFMKNYDLEFDSIYFNWCFFGNSNFDSPPPGSVLLQYTRRQDGLHPFTKTLTRTDSIDMTALHKQRAHFWHRWDTPVGDSMRRANVLKEDMSEYYLNFPNQAVEFLNGDDRHRRIMDVAVIAHIAFKSKEDFVRRVARGTLGNFGGQTAWKERHDNGTVDPFLEMLNKIEYNYLRDYWKKKLEGGWRSSIVPRQFRSNIAVGKSATQSSWSQWSRGTTREEDAGGAVTGQPTGNYSFHTALEDAPWWMVDLGQQREIEEIRIFNRIDADQFASLARRLEISISLDLSVWEVLLRKEDDSIFGGVDGMPLIHLVEPKCCARYVRIQLLDRGYMHLDQVEIYGV